MKKVWMFLTVLLMSCSSNRIHVNYVEEGIKKIHIDTVFETYGLPYRVEKCTSNSGYCVKQEVEENVMPNIDRNIYENVLVQTKDNFIYFVETYANDLNGVTNVSYYYNDYIDSVLLYTNDYTVGDKNRVEVIYDDYNKITYLYYSEDDEVILNEINNGKLNEIERNKTNINDYVFESIGLYNDSFYYKYIKENKIKYYINNKTYEFKGSDKIILLDKGIFVANEESYYIDFEKNKKLICSENVDKKPIYTSGQQFIYQDNTYHLVRMEESQMKVYDLGIKCAYENLWGIKIMDDNPNDILFMIGDGDTIEVSLIKIVK